MKGTRLDWSSVSFTFFKQEKMEYPSFNIPADDGGNALQEELGRLRAHFGDTIDKCRVVIRKERLIKIPRCQLQGQAENDAFRFAAGVGCGSNISKRVQQNALDFIHSR